MLEALDDHSCICFLSFRCFLPPLQKSRWDNLSIPSLALIHCTPCGILNPHHQRLVFGFVKHLSLFNAQPLLIKHQHLFTLIGRHLYDLHHAHKPLLTSSQLFVGRFWAWWQSIKPSCCIVRLSDFIHRRRASGSVAPRHFW